MKDAFSRGPDASLYEKYASSRASGVNEADSRAIHELVAGKEPTSAIELQDTSK